MASSLALVVDTDKELFEGINYVNEYKLVTTSCRITTMTISLSLGVRINLNKITDTNLTEIISKSSNLNCNLELSKKFNNCTIVKCKRSESENVTIKIFSNGNLHMTGAKSVFMAVEYGNLLCRCFEQLFYESFVIQTFSIQLVNATCKFDIGNDSVISLSTFKDIVHERDLQCFYNNDVHAGLRIKLPYTENLAPHQSTVILFATGSLLFNAFLCGKEFLNAYNIITNLFSQHKSDIIKPKLVKEHTKYIEDFDYNKYI